MWMWQFIETEAKLWPLPVEVDQGSDSVDVSAQIRKQPPLTTREEELIEEKKDVPRREEDKNKEETLGY